jgi:hypothetical protein
MPGDIFRYIGRQQFLAVPSKNCAASPVLTASGTWRPEAYSCADARKNAFAPCALHARANAREFLFKGFTDFFCKLQIGRGVLGQLALFRCGGNQSAGNRLRRRWRGVQRRGVNERQHSR